MRLLRLYILSVAGLLSVHQSLNAVVTDPDVYISEYNKIVATTGGSAKGYDYIMTVYNEYASAINYSGSSYSDRQMAVAGLRWLFPYLIDGAFYYSAQNNQTKALTFAEAYIDTYTHPVMSSADLQTNEMYPTLTYFAASNNYNDKHYDKAIKYLDAYIKSGDTKNLPNAFNYSAKAYINTKRNEEAKEMLMAGLNLFPTDLQMLSTVINLLSETKTDDVALQKYVTQALRLRPNEIGLLNIQAQLYERNQNFDSAVEYYKKLQVLKPNNLDIARHLGINLYNSAIYIINTGGKKKVAERKLGEAAAVLSDVVISDPLAMNYLYALANTYSLLDDKQNLDKVNSRIVALGRAPITEKVAPQLLAVNNERVAPSTIPVPRQPEPVQPEPSNGTPAKAAPAPSISDVDKDIPITNYKNDNSFAVIIANSDYKKVSDVENADNDGRIFAEYCNKVLGIPSSHIRTHYNVTYGELLDAIEDIKSIALAKRGNLDVIFYYAGHGIPNEKTKTAYILPVDADGKQTRLCYPLSELYAELNSLNANKTLVFLDACFSGATRSSDEMLFSARGVAIDVDPTAVEGNLVIFSAATGVQSALSYDEQHHGLFTYYLLKRIKETKGNIELGALADYLVETVALESQLRNKKQQMPTVVAGDKYDGVKWKNIKLIR